MFDPSETLSCGCVVEWKSERAYVTPCSETHRTVARMMRRPGSDLIVRPVAEASETRCPHGRTWSSRLANPCPPGLAGCEAEK